MPYYDVNMKNVCTDSDYKSLFYIMSLQEMVNVFTLSEYGFNLTCVQFWLVMTNVYGFI